MTKQTKGAGYRERTHLLEHHFKYFQKSMEDRYYENAYYELCQIMRHARVMRGWLSKKLEAGQHDR